MTDEKKSNGEPVQRTSVHDLAFQRATEIGIRCGLGETRIASLTSTLVALYFEGFEAGCATPCSETPKREFRGEIASFDFDTHTVTYRYESEAVVREIVCWGAGTDEKSAETKENDR